MADLGRILDSLGWALLHSLWQIGVVGIVVFAALRLVRRDQPALRYAIAYAGMVVSLLAFIATFVAGLKTSPATGPALFSPETGIVAMLGQATNYISLVWASGFLLLSLRYAAMIRATHRLRFAGLSAVPSLWQERLSVWADRLGAGTVRIFESALVETPLTVGMFKPLVLVPAGFFLRLPREQAEAILVHELAHICRQDYVFGLIQALIANVFFFHPAIYYLSRQVDLEREHACDARAALETGDRAALAKGLSRVAIDMHNRRIGFAMAARGRHSVVERIRRLGELRGRKSPDDRTPAVALAMLFGAGIIFALALDSGGTAEANDRMARATTTPAAPEPVATADADEIWAETRDPAATSDTTETDWAEARAAPSPKKPKHHADTATNISPAARRSAEGGNVFAVSFSRPGWSGSPVSAMFQQAVYQVQNASPLARAAAHDDDDCPEERARARAEAIAERAAAQGEAYAARVEVWAEASSERAEAEAERFAELAERQGERVAREQERRAEALEARMEAIAERAERLREQKEERDERIRERGMRERERREERLEFERENARTVLTISFVVPVAPAPPIPPAPARLAHAAAEIAS